MWAWAFSAIAVELLCRATLSFYLGNWTFVGFACLRFAPAVGPLDVQVIGICANVDSSDLSSASSVSSVVNLVLGLWDARAGAMVPYRRTRTNMEANNPCASTA